jgi:hypothetical protein
MVRRFMTRVGVAISVAAVVLSLGAGAVFGGEVTGNGKLLEVHARSACAYSGQEDLQFFYDDEDTLPKPEATKGDPAHAQSWGQIPKSGDGFFTRDNLTSLGMNPGIACNPTSGFEE